MRMVRRMSLLVAATAAAILFPSPANAALTINIVESGLDVIATASGSLLGTRPGAGVSGLQGLVVPNVANLGFSPSSYTGPMDVAVITGPSSWGPGSLSLATNSSGDLLYLVTGDEILVPPGYVPGSPIAATDTFAGQTLATLGLTPGTYLYSVTLIGVPVDTITVNVGGGVPEPATWAMMLLGFGGIGFAVRRRALTRSVA